MTVLAPRLGLDEHLTEAICLAHDLGHTPFGHAGQDALHECMREFGGFEHNLQSLRVVDELEERYAEFPGLNLTYEVREGIVKHSGRYATVCAHNRRNLVRNGEFVETYGDLECRSRRIETCRQPEHLGDVRQRHACALTPLEAITNT